MANISPLEAAKRLAAFAAVDRHIDVSHKLIGIGSGSTVPYVVDRIVQQGEKANATRLFFPTGFQSKQLILGAGLALGDPDMFTRLDVCIDGADEVDSDLNAIKGGGACQLREKVLADMSDTWIMVADYRKNSKVLGTTWKQGVPIEVAPFAYVQVMEALKRLGGTPILRMGKAKAGPVVSDNGMFIVDSAFPEAQMKQPAQLLKDVKLLTGVVEVGLFCGMAKAAYFGNDDGTVTVRTDTGSTEQIASVPDAPPTA